MCQVKDVVEVEAPLYAVSLGASVIEAANLMCSYQASAMLVVDENVTVGIVSIRDLLSWILTHGGERAGTVGSMMSRELETIDAEADSKRALEIMDQTHFHHLPVIESGQVVALVSQRELVRRVLFEQEEEIRWLREYMGTGV